MTYTIGEIAKQLQMTPSTSRYYEKEGLLPFIERSEGGVRIFRESDYAFLRVINCLKATGMQIKDIRRFIQMIAEGDNTINERLELFRKRKAEVERQMEELQDILDVINYKCWFYEVAQKHNDSEYPSTLPDEALPPDMRATRRKLHHRD